VEAADALVMLGGGSNVNVSLQNVNVSSLQNNDVSSSQDDNISLLSWQNESRMRRNSI